jgi:hypothetical protein
MKGEMIMFSGIGANVKKALINPSLVVLKLNQWGWFNWMPDVLFLNLIYQARLGRKLNIKTPATLNEKINWMKLYDKIPDYTLLVDKYEVRNHIKELIGDQYLVKLLGIYNNFDEIDFEKLPNKFVIKCTHDSGGIVICTDKANLNIGETKVKINSCLKKNFYLHGREWHYKKIKPRIICEELIETHDGYLPRDYKIFCFNGTPRFFSVIYDRGRGAKMDFYDMEFNKYPLMQHYPNSDYDFERPKNWDDLIRCAQILSKGYPHVRVDFYIAAKDKVLFGELTFSHFSGCEKFIPESYDEYFGKMLVLPITTSR